MNARALLPHPRTDASSLSKAGQPITAMSNSLTYRSDIDGLRAAAVLAVIG